MAHDSATRDAVRRAYVYDRQPIESAADAAGVSKNTARRWKRISKEQGDDWDRARNASRLAAGGLGDITTSVLEDFALLFQSTLDELKIADTDPLKKADSIAKLSDAYVKTMRAAGGGDKQIAKLAIAIEVIELLTQYVRKHKPELAQDWAEVLQPFGATLSSHFSP